MSFLLKATHELKINDVHRILVFAVPSDDKNAHVYIPMLFVDSGLHKQNIIEVQASSKKSLVLNLPSSMATAGVKLYK